MNEKDFNGLCLGIIESGRLMRSEDDTREDQKQQEELQQIWESGYRPSKKLFGSSYKDFVRETEEDFYDEIRQARLETPEPFHIEGNHNSNNNKETSSISERTLGVNPKDRVGSKKVNLALVPPGALVEMAKCMEDGAKKYGAYNWREQGKPVQEMTYIAAALRHLQAYLDGEDEAQDSGHSHLAHAMAGLAVLVDAKLVGNSVDNRPFKGKAGEMLK